MILPFYKVALSFPLPAGIFETDTSRIVDTPCLIFKSEVPRYVDFDLPDDWIPIRWICLSCFEACGDETDVFKTGSAPRRELKRVTGPTQKQQNQMLDHARQHEIMWAWARGLEKK